MKKLILTGLLQILCISCMFAQKNLPFTLEKTHVKIPLDLPGLQPDTPAMSGDYLEYDVTAQVIKDTNAYELRASAQQTDMSTPWLTLQDLIAAYLAADLSKIEALYTKGSQSSIKDFLSAPDAKTRYLADVARKTIMHPYFAMDINSGITAFIETRPGVVERFRFEREKNKYMLAAYVEKGQPMVNNLYSYYYYKPLPLQSPVLTQGIDSVTAADAPMVTFKLKKAGDWVTIFIPRIGYATILAANDNGYNDKDPAAGTVKLIFYGSQFPPKKTYELHAIESNYPLMKVTNSMMNSSIKFTVKVKP